MVRRGAIVALVAVGLASLAVGVDRENLDEQSTSAVSQHALARPLRGWELVESQEFTVPPNSSAELDARCPSGKVPLGGGFSKAPSTPDSPAGVEIASSFPAFFEFEGQRISAWIVHVINRSSANALVTVWATCARRGVTERGLD